MEFDLSATIEDTFTDNRPDGICIPCFLKGVVEGAAVAVVTTILLGEVAALSPFIAIAAGTALAIYGAYGLYQLAANWDSMNAGQKNEAVGAVFGGFLGGAFAPRPPPTPVTAPTFRLATLQTAGGPGIPVVVAGPGTAIAVPTGGIVATGSGLGAAGGVAMMTGGGGGAGSSTTRPAKSASDLDTGRQNIHKPGTNEYKTRSASPKGPPTAWSDPSQADALTLDAYQKGNVTETFPDGSPKEIKWSAGQAVGENGETQVTVKLKQNGQLHGFPSGPKAAP